jgi:tryptophanyl-tRNA synthetase
VGDAEVKRRLADALNRFLDPIRERRAAQEAEQGLVEELIVAGTERTRREVQRTLAAVREAMGLTAALAGFRRAARDRALSGQAGRGVSGVGGSVTDCSARTKCREQQ